MISGTLIVVVERAPERTIKSFRIKLHEMNKKIKIIIKVQIFRAHNNRKLLQNIHEKKIKRIYTGAIDLLVKHDISQVSVPFHNFVCLPRRHGITAKQTRKT